MSASKRKGTAWETAIVNYLRGRGVVHAERRAPSGNHDRGDIAGLIGVVIEAKSAARMELAAWLAEAEQEASNAGAEVGVVWHKRRGKASPGQGYVTMSGATFLVLLEFAELIPTEVEPLG